MLCAKDGYVKADGTARPDLASMIQNNLIALYLTAYREQLRENGDDGTMGTYIAKILPLVDIIPLVAQYELCGRQIFDLRESLVDMLARTDLGDCTLEGWNAPYDAFYVRFGRQDDIKLPFENDQYEYLDGAFIVRTPYGTSSDEYVIKIFFTTVKLDGSGVLLPGYFLTLLPVEQRLPVSAAIEAALARQLTELPVDGRDSEHSALNSHLRLEIEEGISLLRDGAALLVNTLFYLESAGSKDSPAVPGRDVPPSLVARWMNSTPTQRNKQRSNLTASGYTVVRLMGSEVERLPEQVSHGDGNTPRAHWRRGHWRQQPWGEMLSLRKRIWIKPVMVAAGDSAIEDAPGHVYVVGESDLKH